MERPVKGGAFPFDHGTFLKAIDDRFINIMRDWREIVEGLSRAVFDVWAARAPNFTPTHVSIIFTVCTYLEGAV